MPTALAGFLAGVFVAVLVGMGNLFVEKTMDRTILRLQSQALPEHRSRVGTKAINKEAPLGQEKNSFTEPKN
jgi:hypothetical protein